MFNFVVLLFLGYTHSYSIPNSVPPFLLKPLPKYLSFGDYSSIDLDRDIFPLEKFEYRLVKNDSEIATNSIKFFELNSNDKYLYSCFITAPPLEKVVIKTKIIDDFWSNMADIPCISLFDYDPLGWSYEVCPLRYAHQLRISKQKRFLDIDDDIIKEDSDVYDALKDLLGSVALNALNASLKRSGKVKDKNRKFEIKDVVVVKYDIGTSNSSLPLRSAFDDESNFLALEEDFVGGTICEASGLPRSSRIRYECTPDKEEDHIISVIEVDVCNYFIRIGGGRVCRLFARNGPRSIECVRRNLTQ